jgi:hypothetical protein
MKFERDREWKHEVVEGRGSGTQADFIKNRLLVAAHQR